MINKLCIFALLNCLSSLIATCAAEELEVCSDSLGCIKGIHMPGHEIDKYEAFLGIPFAEPPIGDLRLKNPVPAKAWEGTLQATQYKSDCIGKNYLFFSKPVSGDEDCLYLNIFRPVNTNYENHLPVMIFMYGGGYFSASPPPSGTGTEYFMDTQEVIIVTFSYRLGPFGFLSTGDENISGNFGLKDQNLAIKWVHDHISDFGGDPELVTIFGHSSGGSSSHFHMMSSASKGLFQRAMLLSGTVITPYSEVLMDPLPQARKIAETIGVENANELSTGDLASALRKVDAHTLLNAGDVLRNIDNLPITTFRPTVEQPNWPEAFLTDHPDNLLEQGIYSQVPTLLGVVSSKGEGTAYAVKTWSDEELRAKLNANFEQYLTTLLDFPEHFTPDRIENILQEIINEYMEGKEELNSETLTGFMEMFGDYGFYHPFYRTLNYSLQHTELQQNPISLLKFDYRGPNSVSVYLTGTLEDFGCSHGDDLFYLFRLPFVDYPKDSIDALLVKHLVGIYIDFAKNGKLSSIGEDDMCTMANFQSASENGICNYLEVIKTAKVLRMLLEMIGMSEE